MKHAELIARLEAVEVGSRELDVRMEAACNPSEWGDGDLEIALENLDRLMNPQYYTTSLDAALALAERVLPGCCPGIAKNVHHQDWYAWIGDKEEDGPLDLGNARSETPALALCIAILRALDANN